MQIFEGMDLSPSSKTWLYNAEYVFVLFIFNFSPLHPLFADSGRQEGEPCVMCWWLNFLINIDWSEWLWDSRRRALRENRPSWDAASLLGAHQRGSRAYGGMRVFPAVWNLCVCVWTPECGQSWSLSHRLLYKWAWLAGAAGPGTGQLGNLETCGERCAGPAVSAEVVKMGLGHMMASACPYMYAHCCESMLLQGRKHRGQLISTLDVKRRINSPRTEMTLQWNIDHPPMHSTARHKDR